MAKHRDFDCLWWKLNLSKDLAEILWQNMASHVYPGPLQEYVERLLCVNQANPLFFNSLDSTQMG